METRKRGRPQKENASKSGQLRPDECRFSFIADKKVASRIRHLAASRKGTTFKKGTLKELMDEILRSYLSNQPTEKQLDHNKIQNEKKRIREGRWLENHTKTMPPGNVK